MSAVAVRTWLAWARLRARVARPAPASASASARIARIVAHVAGHSFADVGCMWGMDGAIAFAAEAAGARAVSGLDLMPASERFLAEHERRRSHVRFLQGDLHDEATLAQLGPHEVVWCGGVVYHAPHPLLTLQRLASITTETLILASETLPEVPGLRNACVFYPLLDDGERAAHASARQAQQVGLGTPFDASAGYGNWYWGISASALCAMVRVAGFDIEGDFGTPLHRTLIARRRGQVAAPVSSLPPR